MVCELHDTVFTCEFNIVLLSNNMITRLQNDITYNGMARAVGAISRCATDS